VGTWSEFYALQHVLVLVILFEMFDYQSK